MEYIATNLAKGIIQKAIEASQAELDRLSLSVGSDTIDMMADDAEDTISANPGRLSH